MKWSITQGWKKISASRRWRVRAAALLAAAFAITGGMALQSHQRVLALERGIEMGYRHAFAELATYLSEIDVALQKSRYVTTPGLRAGLFAEVYAKATAAQLALGRLPYSDLTLEHTAAFLSRAGDYAFAMARGTAAAQEVDPEALRSLSGSASALTSGLLALQAQLESGMPVESLEQVRSRAERSTSRSGGDSYQNVEFEFPELPTLIYDGPFSQHLEQEAPRSVEGATVLGVQEARGALAAFWGLPESVLDFLGESEGNLPAYQFSAKVNTGEFFSTISKQGGAVVLMYNSRGVKEPRLDDKTGVRLAAEFLKDRGYPEMKESYYTRSDGILTVNFAAVQEGVVCYPDLVKVGVALDNGDIVGFEAAGFVMNHTTREIPEAAVSKEAAEARLAPGLTVLSHGMVITPTAGKYERFCHEFKCEDESGTHVILYVNALTGEEERLLILIEDENGTLTM